MKISMYKRSAWKTLFKGGVKKTLIRALLYVPLALGVIIMIYPLLWMISSSLKHVQELAVIPPPLIPENPTLDNFRVVMEQLPLLLRMFANSFIVAISIPAIQTIIGTMAAYAFARIDFRYRHTIFMGYLCALMIPGTVTIIPVFIIIRHLGLMDNIAALILIGANNIFFIFWVRNFFMSIPRDLDDAAKIDGCNHFQSYFFVHLPLARPIIAVNAILMFNAAWGDYFGPLIFLRRVENMTVPLGLVMMQGMFSTATATVMIASIVTVLIPVIIVFLLGRRHIIAGISHTGMKL